MSKALCVLLLFVALQGRQLVGGSTARSLLVEESSKPVYCVNRFDQVRPKSVLCHFTCPNTPKPGEASSSWELECAYQAKPAMANCTVSLCAGFVFLQLQKTCLQRVRARI